MKKQTSILSTARMLSLASSVFLAGYCGALLAATHAALAASGSGGTGAGGTGTGGSGTGGTGTGSGTGGTGAGTGTGGTGTGTGTGGTGIGTGTGGTGAGTGTGGTGTGTGTGGTGTGIGTGSTGTGTGTGTGGTGTGTGTSGTGAGTGIASGGTSSGSTGTGGAATSGGTGTGTGIGGTGIGSTGIGGAASTGTSGAGIAGTGTGSTNSAGGGEGSRAGEVTWVLRSTGLAGAPPKPVVIVGPPPALVAPPPPPITRLLAPAETVTPLNAPPQGVPSTARPVARALPRDTQPFRFDAGTAMFPTTGGVVTTEQVDGVDLITVDARHHRVIHPAAFFEPHEGAQYDRRAVERFWPIELGKRVRFVETLGGQRWEHVMSAMRTETVSVPAGVFRAFVVERTAQPLGGRTRLVVTYTYWYAPQAGAIVKTEIRPGDGGPAVTEEADVLGYPLAQPGATAAQPLD